MGEIQGTAFLRELESTNQCELMFALKVELENVGLLQEEVKAVRQVTDTVESLLQHIINKIKKSIKTLKEKKGDDTDGNLTINVALRDGSTHLHISPKAVLKNLIQSNMCNMEFQIFDQRYLVVINAPLVKEVKLPLILYANYMVQPTRLYCLFTKHNQFSWYKSKDKETWIKVASTNRYAIKESDVDHYLKLVCVPCGSLLTGPSVEVVSENRVEMMGDLPACPFEERHTFTREKLRKNNELRMVCYNILSNRYADTQECFPYCPLKALAIDYRKQLTTKELSGYNADIMCLQEVDSSVYTTYYKEHFKNDGYLSFYHKKGNKIPEGLACFFNGSRFKKVDDHQIIYSNEIKNKSYTHLRNFLDANKEVKDAFMRLMTSLHVTVLSLKIRNKNHFIIIGNTHLYYHPEAELVRIVQINMATIYLQNMNNYYCRSRDETRVRVILCGDFNSSPASAIYEYLTRGKLNKTHPSFQNSKKPIDIIHNFEFESACGVPKYTNYTQDFKNCLDYIFIEKNKMTVDNIIPFPKEEELAEYEGLPNEVYPSDHLALVVDLRLL